MEEEILLRGSTDFSRVYSEFEKLKQEIGKLGTAKLDLAKIVGTPDVSSIAREFDREFSKVINTISGKFKNQNFLNKLVSSESVEAEVRKIEGQIAKLEGKKFKSLNFGVQLEGAIGKQIEEINLGIIKTEAATKRLKTELASIGKEKSTAGADLERVKKLLGEASAAAANWEKKISSMESQGKTPAASTFGNLEKRRAQVEALIPIVNQLSESYAKLDSREKAAKAEIAIGEESRSIFQDRIKLLEDARKKVESLRTAYKSLGESGQGMAVTPAGLGEQLSTVKELLAVSTLYKDNEQERIALYQAQNRLQQAGLQGLLDQAKAAQLLAESLREVNGRDSTGRTKNAIQYKTAENLIQEFGDPSNLPDTRRQLELVSSIVRDVQGNVKITGDQFRGLEQIISNIGSKLKTAFVEPLRSAADYAGLGLAEFQKEIKSNDQFYRQRQQREAAEVPSETLDRRVAEPVRVSRLPEKGGALALYDANQQAGFAELQKLREFNKNLQEYIRKSETEYKKAAEIADKRAKEIRRLTGESAGGRALEFEPISDADRSGRLSRGFGGGLIPDKLKQQSAIVPYDENIAAIGREIQARQEALEATQRQVAEVRKLVAAQEDVVKAARRTALEGGTEAEISQTINTLRERLANISPGAKKEFGDAAGDLFAARKQNLDAQFEKLSATAANVDFGAVLDNIEGLASRVGEIPALWKFINNEARIFVEDYLPRGSEEAERLAKILKDISLRGQSSPIELPNTAADYDVRRAEIQDGLSSVQYGTGDLAASAQRTEFLNLDQAIKEAEKFQGAQDGIKQKFSQLIASAGSTEGAIRGIFEDFGGSEAGIGAANNLLSKIRGSLSPGIETDVFDNSLNQVVTQLGIVEQAGTAAFKKTKQESEAAAKSAQRYSDILRLIRQGDSAPIRPVDTSFAKQEASRDLSQSLPGSPNAGAAIGDLNRLDFQSTIDQLRNLKLSADSLKDIQFDSSIVQELQSVGEAAKGNSALLKEFEQLITNIASKFSTLEGFDSSGFQEAFKPILDGSNSGAGGVKPDTGSVEALTGEYSKAQAELAKLKSGTKEYEQAASKVVAAEKALTAAKREQSKALAEQSKALGQASKASGVVAQSMSEARANARAISADFGGSVNEIRNAKQAIIEYANSLEAIPENQNQIRALREELARLSNLEVNFDISDVQSDLTDLRVLAQDTGNLLKTVFTNPGQLRQVATSLAPGSRRGLSEALIGGGFPLLFGQGPLAAAGGFGGGIIGPAIAGSGGGFAGGIVGTAIGQALQDSATKAAELGNALLAPADNLSKLAETAALSSAGLQGFAEALAAGGRKSEANALIAADLARNNPRALVAAQQAGQLEERRFERSGSPGVLGNLINGVGNSLVGADQLLGDFLDNAPKLVALLPTLLKVPGTEFLDTTISESFGNKKRFEDFAKAQQALADLSAESRDLGLASEVAAASVSSSSKAIAGAAEINAGFSTRQAEVQELKSQAGQSELSELERKKLEGEILLLQKEINQESKVALATQQSATEAAGRELDIQKQIASVGPGGRGNLEASINEKFQIDGAREAIRAAGAELEKLQAVGPAGKSEEALLNYESAINKQKQAISLANQELAIAEKTALVRLRDATDNARAAEDSLRLAKKLAGVTGSSAEAIQEEEAYGLAARDFNEIAAALRVKADPALQQELRAAGAKLEEASIVMRDNIINAAGGAAKRFLAELQSAGGAESALRIREAFSRGTPNARGIAQAESVTQGIRDSIFSAGAGLLESFRAASASAALRNDGSVDPNLLSELKNSANEFSKTVISAGNQLAFSLKDAGQSLNQSRGELGKLILGERGASVFGVAGQQQLGGSLSIQAFSSAIDRFKDAFGYAPANLPKIGNDFSLRASQERLNIADYLNQLSGSQEQIQSNQALVTSLQNAQEAINGSTNAVVQALNDVSAKAWDVYVTVNGQTGQVNLG